MLNKDIMEMSGDEVLSLIPNTTENVVVNKNGRYQLIKLIYKILGYDLTPDLLLVQLAEDNAMLVSATAGAGKTTYVQSKIILEKISRISPQTNKPLNGEKILCLVYNKHNVAQIETKQRQLVAKMLSSGVKGLHIDNKVNATTMHAFCQMWILQYAGKCGILNTRLMDDNQTNSFMSSALRTIAKKTGEDIQYLAVSKVLNLYNIVRESLIEYDDLDKVETFASMQTSKELLVEVFELYDKLKKGRSLYDFPDMLSIFLKLLRENEEVRTYIQDYYEYITADEFQDFTPIMIEILRLIKRDDIPLICIGDEDQNIYAFRGANINGILNFEELFKDGKVYSLAVNRRCRENILADAKFIIEHNKLRHKKNIKAVKTGGHVEYIPYASQEGQLLNLLKKLGKMEYDDLDNTIICYRNNKSSYMISDILEKNNISFHVIRGYGAFSHELYKHVVDVLDIVYRPYDRDCLLNLYKVLPINKNELYRVVGYNAKRNRWATQPDNKPFFAYDFKEYSERPVFVQELLILKTISEGIHQFNMSEYIPKLFLMIKKYFWNYKMELNNDELVDNYFTSEVFNMFNVNKLYSEFESEYMKRKKLCRLNNLNGEGVALSTFHGLKGLEYKNVFIVDMEEEIFPNFGTIEETPGLSPENIEATKECETRLCYVAMTRAIDNLYVYYSEASPSTYITWLLNRGNEEKESEYIKPEVPNVPDVTMLDVFGTDKITKQSNTALDFEAIENEVKQEEDDDLNLEFDEIDETHEEELNLEFDDMIVEEVDEEEPKDVEEVAVEKVEQKEEVKDDKEDKDNSSDNEDGLTDFLSIVLDRL